MLVSDKPILGYRKGGKLLTKNNFGNELNALMKRLPGEPKYGEFKHSGDAAGGESDDEVDLEESDESVPSEVWNDDVDEDANEIADSAGEGNDETSGEELAGGGDEDTAGGEGSEETEDTESDKKRPYRPTPSLMNLTSTSSSGSSSESDDDSPTEPADDSPPEPDNSSDDNYVPVTTEDDDSNESYSESSSSLEADISDYDNMPLDTKNRKIYTFSPEDQRRIKFRK